MKNFVIKVGRSLLNFAFIVALLAAFFAGIKEIKECSEKFGGCFVEEYFYAVAIIIGGFIAVIMSFFIIYILLDIMDNLRELVKKKKEKI